MSNDIPTPEELDRISDKMLDPKQKNPDGSKMKFSEYVEKLKGESK